MQGVSNVTYFGVKHLQSMRSLLFGRLTPLSCAFFGDVTPYSRVIDPDFGVGCHIFL